MDFQKKDEVDRSGAGATKYKRRFITRAFQVFHSVDYDDIFAPVVKFWTHNVFLALLAAGSLELHRMNVKTGLLNDELEHNIFMEQLGAFED